MQLHFKTIREMYPFVNNVGSAFTEIIWKFYVKFKHP
jgi:hypothetical protein